MLAAFRVRPSHTDLLRFTRSRSGSLRFVWSHQNSTDSLIRIQIHANSFRFMQTFALSLKIAHSLSDSPKLLKTHLIPSRFSQSHSDSPRLAWIHSNPRCLNPIPLVSLGFTSPHSDSQSFASSQVQITCRLSQIHSLSLRFTQSYSDFLRFVHSQVRSHQIQISSDPLRFTTRSRTDLLRLTQIYPY